MVRLYFADSRHKTRKQESRGNEKNGSKAKQRCSSHSIKTRRLLVPIIFFFIFPLSTALYSQEHERQGGADDNAWYRFPFSLAVEYQTFTPFYVYGKDFNVFGSSLVGRIPILYLPFFQPSVELGLLQFDSLRYTLAPSDDPDRWDHTQLFAALGADLAYRFSRSFEAGVDLRARGGVLPGVPARFRRVCLLHGLFSALPLR